MMFVVLKLVVCTIVGAVFVGLGVRKHSEAGNCSVKLLACAIHHAKPDVAADVRGVVHVVGPCISGLNGCTSTRELAAVYMSLGIMMLSMALGNIIHLLFALKLPRIQVVDEERAYHYRLASPPQAAR
jgi:hypothetical protein